MRKKVHLHIGTHKTGTTLTQQTLAENQETLKQRGILYPHTGRFLYGHHLLAFSLSGINTTDQAIDAQLWDTLLQEIHNAPQQNILLSSEEFSFITAPDGIKELSRLLDGFDVAVYVYLRRQDDYLESVYNQQTKDWQSPQKLDTKNYIEQYLGKWPILDYTSWLELWSSNFGEHAINVFNYAHIKASQKGIIEHFCDTVSTGPLTKPTTPTVNRSVSRKALELIRLSKVLELPVSKRQPLFNFALESFALYDGGAFSEKEKAKIRQHYHGSNALIESRFGVDLNSSPINNQYGTPLHLKDTIILISHLLEQQP